MNSMNVIRGCHLRKVMMTRDMLYINGSWTASTGESALLVENPTSEEIICSVPDGTIQDTDLAVEAAKNAFDSWSKSPIQERIRTVSYTHLTQPTKLSV